MLANLIYLKKIILTILLTGFNGFLGQSIYNYLIKYDHNIFGLSRTNGYYKCALEKQVVDFDKTFDLIIHAAGKAHSVPQTDFEKNDFFSVNFIGTANLLKGLEKKMPPKYFVFISSIAVYGLESGNLINESQPLLAKDPYGLSKIKAESKVKEWCEKNNVVCTILRLPLLVGDLPPGNLGAMIKGINNGLYFNIDGGRSKKSMVLVEDVAKSILKIAVIGGIYNLTDGYHPSFLELSNNISIQLFKGKPMNMPLWLAKIIAKFGDLIGSQAPLNSNKLTKITSDLTFDDTKAREAFDWNPVHVLEGFKIN